jgi:malonyl-CoA/methylmalonyl-CoA synthetase
MNLHDLWAIPLQKDGRRTALVAEGEWWSYGELFSAAERVAEVMGGRGVGAGDRVALWMGNRAEMVVAFLAVLRLGAVVLPVNTAYRAREAAHLLADAEPRLVVAEAARREVIDEGAAAGSGRELSLGVEGGREVLAARSGERAARAGVLWAEELAALCTPAADGGGAARRGGATTPAVTAAAPAPGPDGADLAMLLYTSGTTGASKGAMLTHDNLLATITGLLAAWAWEADDVLLLALPLFHTHGLVVGLATALAAGAAVRLHPRFDAARVAVELAADVGEPAGAAAPTLFFGVPTMYVRLVDELARRPDLARRLGRLRLFASGSAPLAPETFAAFRELTGHQPLERYGMTETGMNLSNLYAGPRRPGSVGVPLPGVSARIVDAEGQDVEPGTDGELLVAGANVFAGYWRDPDKTAAAFLTDPTGRRWFRTGDLARRDPTTGAHTLLGRRGDLILVGGYNVYPREIEEVLETHPAVREAAVAGVPDRDKGEVPAAWLVIEPGMSADDDELRTFAAARLAPFKVPRHFHFAASLPRNPLGKVQKHLLPKRRQDADGGVAGGSQ